MGVRDDGVDFATNRLLEQMTRAGEVRAYARQRNIYVGDAIVELVNTALSGTFVDGWCEGWRAGVGDCRRAITALPRPSVDQPSKRTKGK